METKEGGRAAAGGEEFRQQHLESGGYVKGSVCQLTVLDSLPSQPPEEAGWSSTHTWLSTKGSQTHTSRFGDVQN